METKLQFRLLCQGLCLQREWKKEAESQVSGPEDRKEEGLKFS